MTADLSRTILLPIDVQRGFDDPSWPPRWNAEMESNGRFLLAHWRSASAPIVSKSVNSAFIGTDLDLRLRRLGATRIVVFGISTDMCVSTTIRTGANMGWTMTLVPDACDCFDLPDGAGGTIPARAIQAAHVATLAAEFCALATTAELLGAARPAS